MNFEDPDITQSDSIQFEIDTNQEAADIIYPLKIFKIHQGYNGCGSRNLFKHIRSGFVDKKVQRLFYPYNNQMFLTYEYESLLSSTKENDLVGQILVHPNPVADRLTITNMKNIASYELYNMLGQ